ncbi:MAG: hypothetical protein QM817_24355 [Archangium sp.]
MKKAILVGVVALLAIFMLPFVRGCWPASRDSWRTFVRESKGEELAQLGNDYSNYEIQRWNYFLEDLRAGDEEAFDTAERLHPLIRSAAHPNEDLFTALADALPVHTERVLLAIRRGGMPARIICSWADRSAREPVLALLDGGLDETVRECLALP